MVDIEDSVGRIPVLSSSDAGERLFVVRTKRMRGKEATEGMATDDELGSILPWNRRVYLRTWGCSHNNSDSEYMAGQLAKAGFNLTADKDAADLWLLNSCTVKTPSETQLENQVRDALERGKRVVVAGCVSQAAPNTAWLKEVSIVGVQQIDRIVAVVEETLRGSNVRVLAKRRGATAELDLSLPKMRRNEFIEILAINSGCLNHCTYCKTKAARGDLRSFPLDSLLAQARRALLEEGCRELWLTSEDLGAWGRDLPGLAIPDLLSALVAILPAGCMMRLGMTNPPYILDHLEEVALVLRHPRVYAFLHIPVQSGSDAVLSEMKREYCREHFCRIVDFMLENVPGLYIATDFICAFPTETEADFEESMDLVRRYKFPSLFINQFYPRPGTPAARLKKINTVEARRRTSEMSRLFHSYSRYGESRIGEEHWVLVCERASDGRSLVGHNKSYEHILVPDLEGGGGGEGGGGHSSSPLLGNWAKVRIVEVSKFFMRSELLKWSKYPPDENGNRMTGGGEEDVDIASPSSPQTMFGLLPWAIAGLLLILLLKLLLSQI